MNSIAEARRILAYHDDGQLVHKDEYARCLRNLIKLAELKALVCKLPMETQSLSDPPKL